MGTETSRADRALLLSGVLVGPFYLAMGAGAALLVWRLFGLTPGLLAGWVATGALFAMGMKLGWPEAWQVRSGQPQWVAALVKFFQPPKTGEMSSFGQEAFDSAARAVVWIVWCGPGTS